MKKMIFAKIGSFLQAGLLIGSMLAIMPVSAVAAAPTQNWKADSNGIFSISNVSDMLAFAENAEANDWYNGKAVKLTADIDMSGVKWTPIAKFRGFFEGNGRIIKNLTLTSSTPRIAMFDTLDGATIRNLRLHATLTQTGSGGMAALLAVETLGKPVTIENVHVSGTLATPNVSTNYRVGGMIAHVANQTAVKGCANNASIQTGYKVNGGFVGANSFASELTMTDCVYYGTLSKALNVETAGFVGRVVGNVTLTRCINLSYSRGGTSQYQGAFMYLDNKDFRMGGDSAALAMLCPINVLLEDCYTTLVNANDIIVGSHTSRLVYTVTVKYEGNTVHKTANNKADYKAITAACKTLAVGNSIVLEKANFATVCPGFSSWVATNQTATYANSQQIVLVLPRDINQLLVGTYVAEAIPTLTPYEDETTAAITDTETNSPPEDSTEPAVSGEETTEISADTNGGTDEKQSGCNAAVSGSVGAIVAAAGGAMLKCRGRKKRN